MKKILTLMMTLAFTLSCFFSITAYAAENVEPYASTYFSSYSAEIIPNGSGEITIRYSVKAKKTMTELGAPKWLYRKNPVQHGQTKKLLVNLQLPLWLHLINQSLLKT